MEQLDDPRHLAFQRADGLYCYVVTKHRDGYVTWPPEPNLGAWAVAAPNAAEALQCCTGLKPDVASNAVCWASHHGRVYVLAAARSHDLVAKDHDFWNDPELAMNPVDWDHGDHKPVPEWLSGKKYEGPL